MSQMSQISGITSLDSSSISQNIKLNDYKSYVNKYNMMQPVPYKENVWRCTVEGCNAEYTYSGGWTNMGKHILNCHKEILLNLIGTNTSLKKRALREDGQTSLENYYAYVSPTARLYSDWLQLIIFENLALDSCDHQRHPVLAKYMSLESMSRNTLKKYLLLLHKFLLKKIKNMLPSKFAVMFDGWTIGTEHYLGVFAVFMDTTSKKKRVLIGCMVADDVDENDEYTDGIQDSDKHFGLTAADMFEHLADMLKELGYTEEDVNADELKNIIQCLIGDSVSANLKLARDLNIPFVRCRSHLLNLAVNFGLGNPQKDLKKKKDDDNEDGDDSDDEGIDLNLQATRMMRRDLILKEDKIQGCLLAIKTASTLRTNNIKIAPERMNRTRWSSIYKLNKRTIDMYDIKDLGSINFDPKSKRKLSKFLLSDDELDQAKKMDIDMGRIDVATKVLQKDDMNLAKCQAVIDLLVSKVPHIVKLSKHLEKDYLKDELDVEEGTGRKLYTSFHFNNGVIKIQSGNESQLTANEKFFCSHLKKEIINVSTEQDDSDSDIEENDKKRFARELQESQNKVAPAKTKNSLYEAGHIEGTSDPVERLFSYTKRVMSDLRKHMGPETLNAICCLSCNRSLWADNDEMPARILHQVIQEEEEKKKKELEELERRQKEAHDQNIENDYESS